MPNDDTIKLLKEVNAGVKTAVTSIDEVFDTVASEELKELLSHNKRQHELIGNETHQLLNDYGDEEKDPNPMAKVMSWTKINFKLMQHSTDDQIADLIIDGCNMGVKSLSRYKNKYPTAQDYIIELTDRLIQLEDGLMVALRKYLC